jgi:hypothetical protein
MTSIPPAAVLFLGAILLPLLPRRTRPAVFFIFPGTGFLLVTATERRG